MGNIIGNFFKFLGLKDSDSHPVQRIKLVDIAQVLSGGYDCRERFKRLLLLARKALKIFFDSQIDPNELKQHLRSKKSLIEKQEHFKNDLSVLFPKNDQPLSSGDFDISLMYRILRNTTKIAEPTKGWSKVPGLYDQSDTDNVERVRLHNNWMKTNDHQPLEAEAFIRLAVDLSLAILKLSKGSLQEEVQNEGYILWTVGTTIDVADVFNNQNKAHLRTAYKNFVKEIQNSVDRLTKISSEDEILATIAAIESKLNDLTPEDLYDIESSLANKVDMWKRSNPTHSALTQNAWMEFQHKIFTKYRCIMKMSVGYSS